MYFSSVFIEIKKKKSDARKMASLLYKDKDSIMARFGECCLLHGFCLISDDIVGVSG